MSFILTKTSESSVPILTRDGTTVTGLIGIDFESKNYTDVKLEINVTSDSNLFSLFNSVKVLETKAKKIFTRNQDTLNQTTTYGQLVIQDNSEKITLDITTDEVVVKGTSSRFTILIRDKGRKFSNIEGITIKYKENSAFDLKLKLVAPARGDYAGGDYKYIKYLNTPIFE